MRLLKVVLLAVIGSPLLAGSSCEGGKKEEAAAPASDAMPESDIAQPNEGAAIDVESGDAGAGSDVGADADAADSDYSIDSEDADGAAE